MFITAHTLVCGLQVVVQTLWCYSQKLQVLISNSSLPNPSLPLLLPLLHLLVRAFSCSSTSASFSHNNKVLRITSKTFKRWTVSLIPLRSRSNLSVYQKHSQSEQGNGVKRAHALQIGRGLHIAILQIKNTEWFNVNRFLLDILANCCKDQTMAEPK